jgi:glycosyltransferase involved in cell wall biosynthesis
MNILFINHYAGSIKYGMQHRPYYLAREWIKMGHDVTIVASSFSHLRHTEVPIFGRITTEFIDGIRYVWLKTPSYSGNGIGRVINMFSFTKSLYFLDERIIGFKPDVIIASSPHPFVIYPARRIQKKYNSKLVFEVRDLWPLTLKELGGISKWHPFVILMQHAEDYAYRKADKIVSLLPKAIDYMVSRGMSPEKFVYVPNGIAIEEWQDNSNSIPSDHLDILKKLRKEGNLIVGYVGAHGVANALNYLIEAASVLKTEPISFVLVGQGPEKKKLEEDVKSKGLNNVIFLSPVPKSSIPFLLSLIDFLYIGWKRSSLYRFGVSPNKLMDYMMSGKPIIHAIEAGNDLVEESGCGISVSPENPLAIVEAIRKLSSLPYSYREEIGMKGRKLAIYQYNYKILAEKFLQEVSS